MEREAGEVTSFDETLAYGEVTAGDGRSYFFHCTQIADGTRTVPVGSSVTFAVVPGRLGRWEAAEVAVVAGRAGAPVAAVDPDDGTVGSGPWFACPVCGTRIDGVSGGYDICPTCNWEDDPVQHDDPSYAGGANAMSLHDARLTWQSNQSSRADHGSL